MAFAEDLSVFFDDDDFAVVATFGSPLQTVNVIKDSPTNTIGEILSDDHSILGRTSDLTGLDNGDAITVDGVAYTVRESLLEDDGKITRLTLSKT